MLKRCNALTLCTWILITPAVNLSAQSAPAQASTAASAVKTTTSTKPKPPSHDPQALRFIDIAGFGEVAVYKPSGNARGLALFASGDGGWNLGVLDMAHTAVSLGYWIVGYSTPGLIKTLDAGDGDCSNPADSLDKLAVALKTELKIPAFKPILIGYSSGATLVYAALAQAGDTRFGGGLSLGFCPDLMIHKPFCAGAGLTSKPAGQLGVVFQSVPSLPQPWIVLQGEIDQVCNSPATLAFGAAVKGARMVSLPHVGHGFSVTKNWMPQYRQGLIDLQDAGLSVRGPNHAQASQTMDRP